MNPAKRARLFLLAIAVQLLLGLPSISFAQGNLIYWSGQLDFIGEDSGTGALTGGVPGMSTFDGYFGFPTSCGAGCVVEPFPPDATNYVFANSGGHLRGLGASIPSVEASVEIIDEQVLDADGVAFAAAYGISATVGQAIDVWTVSAENTAEFTPAFVDWNVSFLYFETDPFNSTAYVPAPPAAPDLIIFEVFEDNGDVYEGVGPAAIPEPDFFALLLVGVGGLVVCNGRRSCRARA
ncbi:MAG: hypothetical protein AB8G23_02525 [Myxococcota bacterium]